MLLTVIQPVSERENPMAVSKEVQAAVDQIRRDKDLIASMREADKVRDKQLADLQAKFEDHPSLSDEDKAALTGAVDDIRSTNDELGTAVPANTDGQASAAPAAAGTVAPVDHPDHPTEAPTSGDVLNANGPANHPAGGSAPLMPTSAFDPAGGVKPGPVEAGQAAQPVAIETPGGFVIAGGGSTSRAPGSSPESPSSSLVVPTDPDAKGPNSTADVVKSGLGDSSQNALLGNDGQPIADGPGMVQEPSPAKQEVAQKQADLAADEKARREENPLNLAEPGTPIAGSAQADADALKRRQQEQFDAMKEEQARNAAQQGRPAPGTPGPDPVAGPAPTPAPVDVDKPNAPALP